MLDAKKLDIKCMRQLFQRMETSALYRKIRDGPVIFVTFWSVNVAFGCQTFYRHSR